MKRVRLAKLSVCDCGFPAFDGAEGVNLGDLYSVDVRTTKSVTWTCGGCHKQLSLPGIWAARRGVAGYLPVELFDLGDSEQAFSA